MSWDLDLDEASWFFGPGWGQAVCGLHGALARWLGQWVESWRWTNSQHRKIVSLSPLVSKNLNLKKVIKVSYLNQESRQCFVFFGFLCVWTFYEHYERFIHPYICIVVSWLYYRNLPSQKWVQIFGTWGAGEEARRQLHKNAASNIEQVMAATPHKAPTIRPPASHHENYPS